MMTKILQKILRLFVFGIILVLPNNALATQVTDLRIGDHGDFTRFVLELSSSVNFRVFTLHSPYRVVIDLPIMDWNVQDRLRHEVLKNKNIGYIKNYRYGLYTHDTFRIVLDVSRPVKIQKAYQLSNKTSKKIRFIVDLVKDSHRNFVKNSGYQQGQGQKTVSTYNVQKNQPQAQIDRKYYANNSRPLIVIDPGHGGVDAGAIGVRGSYEKNIVLAFAKKLRSELAATNRYRVLLTRNNDLYIPLRQRIEIARKANAALFISIHADSISKKNHVRGASVYSLSETASDKEAEALARKENQADIIAGVDFGQQSEMVTSILIDLAQRDTMNKSAEYAGLLVNELKKVTKTLKGSHRFAGFAVLKAPDIPSVLVELGFLSNVNDEQLLLNSQHQKRVAKSIVKSIDKYFSKTKI